MISTGPKTPIGMRAGYECKTCGMTFESKKELQAHNKKTHGANKR
jgi:uncharacterized C2H2 Zn-finger protein